MKKNSYKSPGKATRLLLLSALTSSSAFAATYEFDFSRTTGDRAHNFGTNQTSGSLSDANSSGSWQTISTGIYRYQQSTGPQLGWSILNDSQPDTINGTLPAGSDAFNFGSTLEMRTLVTNMSSGVGGVNSLGGFIFGLDDFSSTASGYIAVLERNPGVAGYVSVYNFTNGTIGTQVAQSSSFTYDSGDDLFLDFSISGGTYTLNAFADGDISGTGSDISRFASGDFDTATAVATISGSLGGYTSGYAGVVADTGTTTATGSVDLGMFHITTIPEPGTTTLALAGVAGLVAMARRRKKN